MQVKTTKVMTQVQTTAKAITVLGTTLVVLSLCGCMGMSSKFDCNVSSGGRCAPMNSIHKMSDQEIFNDNSSSKLIETIKNIENSNMVKTKTPQGYPLDGFIGRPIRSAETVQQIWIGPYEDTNGNYHEPAYLYVVVKKGRWISEEKEVIQGAPRKCPSASS